MSFPLTRYGGGGVRGGKHTAGVSSYLSISINYRNDSANEGQTVIGQDQRVQT